MNDEQNSVPAQTQSARRRTVLVAAVIGALAIAGLSVLIVRAERTTSGAAIISAVNSIVKSERIVVAIDGMHCSSCSSGITAMLKRTPGVISADASYERKEAVVEFDPARTSREKIIEVINNLGYKASLKS